MSKCLWPCLFKTPPQLSKMHFIYGEKIYMIYNFHGLSPEIIYIKVLEARNLFKIYIKTKQICLKISPSSLIQKVQYLLLLTQLHWFHANVFARRISETDLQASVLFVSECMSAPLNNTWRTDRCWRNYGFRSTFCTKLHCSTLPSVDLRKRQNVLRLYAAYTNLPCCSWGTR